MEIYNTVVTVTAKAHIAATDAKINTIALVATVAAPVVIAHAAFKADVEMRKRELRAERKQLDDDYLTRAETARVVKATRGLNEKMADARRFEYPDFSDEATA